MEKYKISIGTKDSENQSIVIDVSGELTVSHIENIRDEILQAAMGASSIKLNIKEISMIDLSFLQLLISMKKSEGIWVKEFSSTIDTEGEFYNLITETGFNVKI